MSLWSHDNSDQKPQASRLSKRVGSRLPKFRVKLWPDVVLVIAVLLVLRNSYLILSNKTGIDAVNEKIKVVVPRKTGEDKTLTSPSKFESTPQLSAVAQNEALQLQKIVDNFVSHQSAPFGIYVKDLRSNALAVSKSDQTFPSASLYKLYVADLIFHQIDLGNVHLSSLVGQTGHNVHECLNLMITISDNDCGQGLGGMVHWNLSNSIISDRGYTHSNLDDPPQTSAGDSGKLLEHLYQQLDETSNNDQLVFLELLKHQQINDRLPAGLPSGTVIAHKTGNIDDYVHDVGIVYGNKTNYVISVLSGPWPSPGDAPAAFAQLSQQIYAQTQQ